MTTSNEQRFVIPFSQLGIADVPLVGGKNASLGEMVQHLTPLGVNIPDGFAITAVAYRHFLRHGKLDEQMAGRR
ncbi:MAG TPA: PEP/pyruvate-binding domain-containing protein [Pirellulaceae bacterium]|nr:PEP/pyruvate-binding domain-containing protein [Pirellulaceae bacterium]